MIIDILRFALRLILIFAAILFLTRLVGAMRPASPLAAVFSNPDGTPCDHPCVFGIHPGETSIEQAVSLLGVHLLTRDAVWMEDGVLQLSGPDTYVTFRATRDGLVESIVLTATLEDAGEAPQPGSLLDSITVGDYLLVFDVTEVNLPASPYLVFLYPEGGTLASTVRPADFSQRIDARMPLANLIVSIPLPCRGDLDYAAGGVWNGFMTIARYYAQRTFVPVVPSQLPVPPVRVCQR
ncbi:MAG: hypothetical protein ABI835_08790 [Chloroflexota bacterium]